ncbi:molybdate ABC transporter substrate-binding protein [Clostridium sp. PL3]|uniref:Molybdate ABC transporter substrate-binding protein n=1 Tax=Clostridium thailandense TaxID=2794346 RepID=A0A949TJ32_9CLOT|nr:molybdate ABC transporter substrate-binding protein [Clostridium thailandense]MBV7273774.1 molybdate ABC transporter substrate-binding protein [Clostridium thailandense]
MKSLRKNLFAFLLLGIILVFVGCENSNKTSKDQGNTDSTKSQSKAVTLTVSAAASLKDAMEEIKQAYNKEKPNIKITYNFGASGTLQNQIEQGAPVDIFISAGTKQMDVLKQKNLLLNETVKNLLENEVVLIAPKDAENITGFNDLAEDKVKKIALGEPKTVPVGQYSEEVLTNLKLMDKVKSKIVLGKDVKEVLAWVETKNVDAGIVYETDAKISNKVKIIAKAPKDSHKPVIYPGAVIKNSKNADVSIDFMNFVSGEEGKDILEKYGFKVSQNK